MLAAEAEAGTRRSRGEVRSFRVLRAAGGVQGLVEGGGAYGGWGILRGLEGGWNAAGLPAWPRRRLLHPLLIFEEHAGLMNRRRRPAPRVI